MSGFANSIYRGSDIIMKLAYLNLLWIAFSLLGGIILGVLPATVALFTIVRKWIMGDKEISIFQTFWQCYKSDFVTINVIGLVLGIIGFILAVDIYYFSTINSLLSKSILILFGVLGLFYLITILYLFPTYVHFELKGFQYVKYALILGITNIVGTILIVLGCVAVTFVYIKLPATLLFFSMSVMGVIVMWPAYRGFIRVNNQGQMDLVKTNK
ncbi:YesL family protein [Niallia sp. FSL W8-1348]|uniref:YesL family protein n=1 Tax=Niallia sp. FSL W8-1348 TaxID=2954656 RepID=UPI0030F8345D